MGFYSVILKPAVEKDLRSIPKKILARVFERIEMLESDAFPRQSLKLKGSEQMYRLRVGDYRIIYEINRANQQIIVSNSHYDCHCERSVAECGNLLANRRLPRRRTSARSDKLRTAGLSYIMSAIGKMCIAGCNTKTRRF